MEKEAFRTISHLKQCTNELKKSLSYQATEKELAMLIFALFLLKICKNFIDSAHLGFDQLHRKNDSNLTLISDLEKYSNLFKSKLLGPTPLIEEIGESAALKLVINDLEKLCYKIDLSTICYSYEALYELNNDNKEGQFYTPQSVVNLIVRDSVAPVLQASISSDNSAPTILDPTCGSGLFILAAFRAAIQVAKTSGFDSWQWRCDFLSKCCFGVDKDELAVEICRIIIVLAALEGQGTNSQEIKEMPDLSKNFIVGNSLFRLEDFNLSLEEDRKFVVKKTVFSWKDSFPAVSAAGGFDCIIGNPPYGISRDQQIDPEENQRLKNVFATFCQGKINKYLAFMAQGYQLLKPAGVLSYIVPNAWLGIRDGLAIRKILLREKGLNKLIISPASVFKELGVETVIFQIIKGGDRDNIQIIRPPGDDLFDHSSTVKLSTETCLSFPDNIIPTFWNQDLSALYQTIKDNSQTLAASKLFLPRIALQAYSVNKGTPPQTAKQVKEHVYHTNSGDNSHAVRYLRGQDVKRYTLSWSGEYLLYGPWLAEPQKLEWFSGPRIILREVLDRPPYLLRAAYTEEVYLYNKSALHILPLNDTAREDMVALLAILNSKLASFILCLQGRKTQRGLFPKIVKDDLSDFPLPLRFSDARSPLSKEVRAIINEQKEENPQLLLQFDQKGACLQRQSKIDNMVFDFYGIEREDRKTIDHFLTFFSKSLFATKK